MQSPSPQSGQPPLHKGTFYCEFATVALLLLLTQNVHSAMTKMDEIVALTIVQIFLFVRLFVRIIVHNFSWLLGSAIGYDFLCRCIGRGCGHRLGLHLTSLALDALDDRREPLVE